MKKINLESVKKTRRAFLFVAFILAGLSLACIHVFIVLYFTSQNKGSHYYKELFYWCSMCFATLCLCVLPIMSYYKSIEEKEESRLKQEAENTTRVLNEIGELIHSKDFKLANSVLRSFLSKASASEICNSFHEYGSNKLFVNDFENAINSQIAKNASTEPAKDRFPETKWQFMLANSVLENWFHAEDFNNKYDKTYQKIDAAINSLIYILNKLEIISYQFLDIRINKEVFIDEIFEMIDRLYSKAYYILFKTKIHTSFPRIDSMCRMIYLEKNAK